MKLSISSSKRKGFTLVELLVAISIVVGLAGIAFVVVMKQVDNAKLMEVRKACGDIADGVDLFYTDNNTYPVATYPRKGQVIRTEVEDPSEIITILLGREKGRESRRINRSGAKYLAGTPVEERVGGIYLTAGGAGMYDIWGNPYYVLLDTAGQDEIEDPFTGKPIFNKRALVYSTGADGMGSQADNKVRDKDLTEDNVYSWKKD